MPKKDGEVTKLTVADVVKKLFQEAKVLVLDEHLATEMTKTRLVLSMEGLLVEINKMRKEAHGTVKQKKDSLQNQIIKLNLVQNLDDEGSAPRDKAHSACVFCQHPCLDEPSSNVDLLQSNLVALSDHNR
jgi:hypothetical protein